MLIIRNSFFAVMVGWSLWATTSSTLATEGRSLFPIQISASGRFIEDANGKPFLMHGDTAWSLLLQLTKEEAEEYLENPRQKDWRAGMDRQPSREMVHVKKLFDERAWHELVPDQNHSVVTKGFGTFGEDDKTPGGDYVTAARTNDGSLVMAYVPSTGTEPRTITVDMTKLSGPANARWYNPTNGSYTPIANSPLANTGSREFTTPGDNGTGTSDWVLVLATATTARVGTNDGE